MQEVLVTVRANVSGLSKPLTEDTELALFEPEVLQRLEVVEVLDVHGVHAEATFVD